MLFKITKIKIIKIIIIIIIIIITKMIIIMITIILLMTIMLINSSELMLEISIKDFNQMTTQRKRIDTRALLEQHQQTK